MDSPRGEFSPRLWVPKLSSHHPFPTLLMSEILWGINFFGGEMYEMFGFSHDFWGNSHFWGGMPTILDGRNPLVGLPESARVRAGSRAGLARVGKPWRERHVFRRRLLPGTGKIQISMSYGSIL